MYNTSNKFVENAVQNYIQNTAWVFPLKKHVAIHNYSQLKISQMINTINVFSMFPHFPQSIIKIKVLNI